MTNYRQRLDRETWDFIEATQRWYPPDTTALPLAEQRRIYNEMCRAFFRGYPGGLAVADQAFAGVPCRVYRPDMPPPATVLHLHGGGFVLGGLHSHDDICAEIAASCGLRVVSVDYRLAPEHPHPAAFNDALAAARAVAAAFDGPLVLVGDSAGGTLAAAVAHAGRALGLRPWGQVLIYPSLGGDESRGSYQEHAEAPMLTLRDIAFYRRMRFPNGAPRNDPTAAPLQDNNFRDLPPTVIFVAECDPLADDGSAYAEKLLSAGGRALVVVETGLVHGYLRARATVSRARESFRRITTAIAALAQGNWPEELL